MSLSIAPGGRDPPDSFQPFAISLLPCPFSRTRSFFRSGGTRARRALACNGAGLPGKCFPRRSRTAFAFQRSLCRARTRPRNLSACRATPFGKISLRLFSRSRRSLTSLRWRQLHTGPSRFRQTDGDCLLGRPCPVFSFTDVLHFFAHEFARLRGRRFAFASVLACPFDCFLFWH